MDSGEIRWDGDTECLRVFLNALRRQISKLGAHCRKGNRGQVSKLNNQSTTGALPVWAWISSSSFELPSAERSSPRILRRLSELSVSENTGPAKLCCNWPVNWVWTGRSTHAKNRGSRIAFPLSVCPKGCRICKVIFIPCLGRSVMSGSGSTRKPVARRKVKCRKNSTVKMRSS